MLNELYKKESELVAKLDNLEGCEDNPVYEAEIKDIRKELSDVQENIKLELWRNEEKSVTLTKHEWNDLTTYILMTTNYRKGELEAWEKLAKEEDENGNKVFQNAESNVEFWKDMNKTLYKIKKEIDKY